MAPEGEATGGGGGDFISQLAGSDPAAGGQTAGNEPMTPPAADPPPAAGANPGGAPAGVNPTAELPGWVSATTKELRADPRFNEFAKGYNKLDELVKSAMDLKTKAGETPEKPDEYEIDVDAGLEYTKEAVAEFKKLAHELGLTKAQAAKLYKVSEAKAKESLVEYQQRQAQEKAAQEKAKAEAFTQVTAELQKLWGKDYKANQETAKRGMAAYASPGLAKALQNAGLGNNAEVIQHFFNLGKQVREDSALYQSGHEEKEKSLAERMYPDAK